MVSVNLHAVFIRISALGAYLILPFWDLQGGRLFEGGRLLFFQHFQQNEDIFRE